MEGTAIGHRSVSATKHVEMKQKSDTDSVIILHLKIEEKTALT